MKRLIVPLLIVLTLSGCASPETRIRNALIEAGLSKTVAGCMAGRMVDRLSLGQLNKLRGLGKLQDNKGQKLSVAEYVARTKALQDPEIVSVVTSSGVICAISG